MAKLTYYVQEDVCNDANLQQGTSCRQQYSVTEEQWNTEKDKLAQSRYFFEDGSQRWLGQVRKDSNPS